VQRKINTKNHAKTIDNERCVPTTRLAVCLGTRGKFTVMTGELIQNFGAYALILSLAVVIFGGFVKGAVGFGLPMIMVGGLGSYLPAEVAVAGLILPTLTTNFIQAFRGGGLLAFGSLRQYWRFNLVFAVTIALSAQLVVLVPERVLFVILGSTVVSFGMLQFMGWQLRFNLAYRNFVEAILGLASGLFGGLSGVWGPPMILYLLALDVPKVEQVRALGITFLLGSVILVSAHIRSGVLNDVTIPFSAVLILPAVLGMFLGYRLQDSLDQARFRKLTLFVLVIVGLNLLRRGIFS